MSVAICKERGAETPLSSKIIDLNAKIKQRHYKFEESKCFCGIDDSVEICDRDRYGIFYSMHLCKNCGLMFAKYQMDSKTTKEFYEYDYRDIYDHNTDKDRQFDLGSENSKHLKQLLDDSEVNPEVIFEIGCNDGSMLTAFKDKEIYGVDLCEESIGYGKKKGLNLICGGIEKLDALGKKADLVILHHVLEHFGDLEAELEKISELLTPTGVLYIGVPGFYGNHLPALFQNAHNWQFTTNTLEYVMACCGYRALFLDSNINSLWVYTGEKRSKKAFYHKEAKDIWGNAFSGKNLLPYISTHCKFPLRDRRQNIRENLSYRFPDLRELHGIDSGNESIIISGGPSINRNIGKIHKLIKRGFKIISIDRMYNWCLAHKIRPDYVLAIDAHENVIESFTKIDKNTIHIISSNVKPTLCEILKDYKTYIFSCEQAGIDNLGSLWKEFGYDKISLHNIGGSVSLGGFVVSLYLGMRNIHYFGFDCHIGNGEYAKGIADNGGLGSSVSMEIDGKTWKTTYVLASFAQQFFELYVMAKNTDQLDSVKIYGKSFIKAMSKIDLSSKGD